MEKIRRLILAVLLLGLLLVPLETSGVIKRGVAQLGEVASSKEVRVLVTRIKTVLPNLGARVLELVRNLLPQFEIKIKETK